MIRRYYYPCLSNIDCGFFRIGGAGLANCMFVSARAYVNCKENNGTFISPTWKKFSIGPILRHEKDKRIYSNLFYPLGISGWKKVWMLIRLKICKPMNIQRFSGLGNYFMDLNNYYPLVREYFDSIIRPETIMGVNGYEWDKYIAVHVRLGDYLPHLRISIEWYKKIIKIILEYNPRQKFLLFSDGNEEELIQLLSISQVKKVFFGNAFADMYAISKCKLLIGSDSTFSAWGAFLGQKPIIFNRRHFPPVYNKKDMECIVGDTVKIPSNFIKYITER